VEILPRRSALVRCPKCGGVLDLEEDEVEEGELLSCPECEADLEVVKLSPVQVNVLSEEGEEAEEKEDEDEEELEEEEEDEEEEEHR
jgi:alpha-aminoadipate carrier protein LysW